MDTTAVLFVIKEVEIVTVVVKRIMVAWRLGILGLGRQRPVGAFQTNHSPNHCGIEPDLCFIHDEPDQVWIVALIHRIHLRSTSLLVKIDLSLCPVHGDQLAGLDELGPIHDVQHTGNPVFPGHNGSV